MRFWSYIVSCVLIFLAGSQAARGIYESTYLTDTQDVLFLYNAANHASLAVVLFAFFLCSAFSDPENLFSFGPLSRLVVTGLAVVVTGLAVAFVFATPQINAFAVTHLHPDGENVDFCGTYPAHPPIEGLGFLGQEVHVFSIDPRYCSTLRYQFPTGRYDEGLFQAIDNLNIYQSNQP